MPRAINIKECLCEENPKGLIRQHFKLKMSPAKCHVNEEGDTGHKARDCVGFVEELQLNVVNLAVVDFLELFLCGRRRGSLFLLSLEHFNKHF